MLCDVVLSVLSSLAIILLRNKELGPELQSLLKVKEDLSKVLIFQDAKNNVSN